MRTLSSFAVAALLLLVVPNLSSAQVSPSEPSGGGMLLVPVPDDAPSLSAPVSVTPTWLGLQATKLFLARFGIARPITTRDLRFVPVSSRLRGSSRFVLQP